MKREKLILISIFIILFIGVLFLSKNITSNVILEEIQIEDNFKYEKPEIINNETALKAINFAEENIKILKENGFGTYFVNDKLIEAKTAYDYANYEGVFKNTQLISYVKDQGFKILDTLAIIGDKERKYADEGVNTNQAKEYIQQGKKSLDEERYNEAEAFLKESEIKLDRAKTEKTRFNQLVRLSKNFFVRYWWQLIILLVLLVISAPFVYKKIRIKIAGKKLEHLKLELKILNNLLKKTQEDAFKTKIITMSNYKIRSERYKNKIAEIKHTIPVLEEIIASKNNSILEMLKRRR